jgi:hypothetical protein
MHQLENQPRRRQGDLPVNRRHAHAVASAPADSSIDQTKMLQEALRRERAENSYRQLQRRIVEFLHLSVPRGSTVLVMSKGDDELLEIPGRRGWHFPRAINGLYAGCYPSDSREALEHLSKLQTEGAEYLAIPISSFWWLEFYQGLAQRLERRHRLVAFHEEICVVFKLISRKESEAFAPPTSNGRGSLR